MKNYNLVCCSIVDGCRGMFDTNKTTKQRRVVATFSVWVFLHNYSALFRTTLNYLLFWCFINMKACSFFIALLHARFLPKCFYNIHFSHRWKHCVIIITIIVFLIHKIFCKQLKWKKLVYNITFSLPEAGGRCTDHTKFVLSTLRLIPQVGPTSLSVVIFFSLVRLAHNSDRTMASVWFTLLNIKICTMPQTKL